MSESPFDAYAKNVFRRFEECVKAYQLFWLAVFWGPFAVPTAPLRAPEAEPGGKAETLRLAYSRP